jgi:hypothetical protein
MAVAICSLPATVQYLSLLYKYWSLLLALGVQQTP